MKKYFYDDLRAMSQPARELWMCDQCSEFGKAIEHLITDREKETFAEEMHRKLRQVTKRWTSWNHKLFGNVTSRKSVGELFAWEQSTKLFTSPLTKTGNQTLADQNILKRFQELCESLKQLHEAFTHDILEPMCDFFQPNSRTAKLDHVIGNLRDLLSRWKGLLAPGMIDETLFAESSSKYLHAFILRGRSYNYDSVIRLVPDLLQKAYLALSLARKWRLLYNEYCITREGTYTLFGSSKVSKKERGEHSRYQEHIKLLEKQAGEVQSRCNTLKAELEECQDKCRNLENDLAFYTDQCERLTVDVETAKQTCDAIKEKLELAKEKSEETSSHLSNSQQYRQVLQQELNASKIKYCTQKIKLVNAKKRCATLADELEKATKDHDSLRMEEEISQKKHQMLNSKLENCRKNIVIQGSMVDTLQQQCYFLKKELDNSTASCKTATEALKAANEKCESLESVVRQSDEARATLEEELKKAAAREQLLRRENAELRGSCEASQQTDESCSLNTPIER